MDKVKLSGAALIVVAALFGYYQWPEVSALWRTIAILVALIAAAGISLTTVPGREFVAFAGGMRNEVRKVIWPTRRETAQATLVVIVMVIIIGIYIWVLDWIAFWAVYDAILRVGS